MNFLTCKRVEEAIKGYGFSEITDILAFLNFSCCTELDASELAYIREKIDICLRKNDNGDNYFIPLREFATELDCLRKRS